MNEQVFSILEQIYVELYEMFQFDDFHFGGTDMSFKCWNSSSAVTDYMLQRDHLANLDDEGVVAACLPASRATNTLRAIPNPHFQFSAFLALWSEFQAKTTEAMRRVMGGNTVGKILWSSRLTNGSTLDTLPPEEYKIQYVGDSSDLGDPQLRTLFEKGLSHSHEWMCSSMTTRLIDD